MDPLSALSISAAVVQFADFGYRLLKNAHEIYKASSTQEAEQINIATVSRDLSRLADDVESKLDANGAIADEVFRRLCHECRTTRNEIEGILCQLRATGSNKLMLAASSWIAALKKVCKGDKIDQLADQLSQIRQQMVVAVLSLLLGEAQKNGMELRQFAKTQNDIIATLDRIDGTTKEFSANIVSMIEGRRLQEPVGLNATVRYVFSNKWEAGDFAKMPPVDVVKDRKNIDRVLESLFFDSMGNRETDIPKKHAETFEWAFKEPRKSNDGRDRWSHLPRWLEGDSRDIYWITGKPGAGKSTLIKFIGKDPRLEEHLKAWTKDSQLIIARFFAWNAGMNKLQKTHEGLFRTLLLEVLQQKPRFVANLFPARWFLLQSFQEHVSLSSPTRRELQLAIQSLFSETGDTLKLALVIDGLDEFQDDHKELLKVLREANASSSLKIIVSSRPWNVFKDEYARNPTLQLESLTREDIQLFIKDKLELSAGYQNFQDTNPKEAGEIITNIVNKAQGVFLWVSVISGLLETSFQEGARVQELQKIIQGLPDEISELFQFIWDRTSARFRAEASRYFRIMDACRDSSRTLYGLTLWFGDSEIPVNMDPGCLTEKYLSGVFKSLERMLISRTGGLLELFPDPDVPALLRVDFMHRTASDWVNSNWDTIVSSSEDSFDASLWILKGEILRLTSFHPGVPRLHDPYQSSEIVSLAKLSSRIREDLSIANGQLIVDLFDRFDEKYHPNDNDYRRSTRGKTISGVLAKLQSSIPEPTSNNFLELAAIIPIPAYIRQKALTTLGSSGDGTAWEKVLHLIVFAQLWRPSSKDRNDMVSLLLENKVGLGNLHLVEEEVDRFLSKNADLGQLPQYAYFQSIQRVLEAGDNGKRFSFRHQFGAAQQKLKNFKFNSS